MYTQWGCASEGERVGVCIIDGQGNGNDKTRAASISQAGSGELVLKFVAGCLWSAWSELRLAL